MKIETIEIAGLAGALTALRLPFGKEVRSKIENYCAPHLDFTDMDVEQTEDTYEVSMKGLPKFTSNTYITIDRDIREKLKAISRARNIRIGRLIDEIVKGEW